jgi:hypothetical protein
MFLPRCCVIGPTRQESGFDYTHLSLGLAPRYLLRDRDGIFGREFVEQVKAMGIKEVLSAPLPVAVAANLRRARDWKDPARVPRLLDCFSRTFAPSNPRFVFRLLSPIENASFAAERFPGAALGSAAGNGSSRGGPTGRRSAPSLRTTRRLSYGIEVLFNHGDARSLEVLTPSVTRLRQSPHERRSGHLRNSLQQSPVA